MTIHCIVGDESLTQELLAVLSMMVGTNVTSGQLLSIADRMLLETDLDKVTKYSTWHMHQRKAFHDIEVHFPIFCPTRMDSFLSRSFKGPLTNRMWGRKCHLAI